MIRNLSSYIIRNILYKNEKIDNDQREIMVFGLNRILEDIPKFLIIILIGYLFNILTEFFIVFLITVVYKTFIGGVHARTNIGCLIVSIMYFIMPVIIAKNINYTINIYYVLYIINCIFSIYVIIKIAPADTEEIPIINKGKRKKLKIGGGVSFFIITMIVILFFSNLLYMKIILYTMFLINLFSINIMYKLFKNKLGRELEEFY